MQKAIRKIKMLNVDKNVTFLLLFIFGVVVGSIFVNFLSKGQLNELSILNHYFMDKYVNINLNKIDLLKYIFYKRIKTLIIIWIIGLTFLGLPTIIIIIIFLGISFGFMISIGTITYGFKGILLNLSFLFPHYVIYVPLFVFIINKIFKISSYLYFKKSQKRFYTNKKQVFVDYTITLLVCMFIIFFGSLIETFLNPDIVKWVIKNLNFI